MRQEPGREFFGESFEAWKAALEALHAFAHKSGAPAGANVTRWFEEQMAAYSAFCWTYKP